ncbi:MAG: hydroxyphenylacetyl-CoA thioesterase PaaI [Hydrogenophilales bacterium]|jgi:acyl-CoA thioesterase
MENKRSVKPKITKSISKKVANLILKKDFASKSLGIELIDISPGKCQLEMIVKKKMLNGFGVCHGGIITTLADSAFAFACNSYNELALASSINVDFLKPANLDDKLIAIAHEINLSFRNGLYNVDVFNGSKELIATMRGRSVKKPKTTFI